MPPVDPIDGFVLLPNNPDSDTPNALRVDNLDGFKNELTGIGDPFRDKTFGGNTLGVDFIVNFLPGVACEDRWRGSDLGGRIVETVPDEMTREGWDLSIQPTDDKNEKDDYTKTIEAIEDRLRELDTTSCVREALCYERAYGGSAVLLGVDDGERDLTKPLDESRVKRVSHLTAFRGGWDGEIIAVDYYKDPRLPQYGMPSIYQLRNLGVPVTSQFVPLNNKPTLELPMGPSGPYTFYVHESRLLVFPGQAVSRRARAQMRGWGDSIFTRVDEVLSQYNQTWGGLANLMTDWAQGVLKMDGLALLLAHDNPKSQGTVARRAQAINMSKSIARTMFIDTKEEFKRETTPLGGVAEVMQQFALRLAAAADMPVALLMGQAPAGLNATGASDIRFFYDRVRSKQHNRMMPQLRQLVRLLFLAQDSPTDGKEPKRWMLEPKALWQSTEAEAADLRNKQAQTDNLYVTMQAVTPEEIAASRFGGATYSTDTVIDLEGRKAMAQIPPHVPEATAVAGTPNPNPQATPKIPAT